VSRQNQAKILAMDFGCHFFWQTKSLFLAEKSFFLAENSLSALKPL
jgi:hypothetical protein